MSQIYEDIAVTEKVYNSLSKLLERDKTGVTCSSGIAFPQEIESWMIGRMCLRTDLKCLYCLSSTDPVTWTLVLDFSQPLATVAEVQENYQPLNSNLTALSNIAMSSNSIPYFDSNKTMNVLSLSGFGKDLINTANDESARNLLGLGSLSTVSKITASNVDSIISDGIITSNKLDYIPITEDDGYTLGDVKCSYDSESENGYLDLDKGYSIGNSASGATHKGDIYSNLFFKLWSLSNIVLQDSTGKVTSKGSSASSDWTSNKRLILPSGFKNLNANAYYRIKY